MEPFPQPVGWTFPGTVDTISAPRGADVRAVSVGGSISDAEMALQLQLSEMQALQAVQMHAVGNAWQDDIGQTPAEASSFDVTITDPVWGEVKYINCDPSVYQTSCFACCPCWTIGFNGGIPACVGKNQLPTSPEDARRAWMRFLCSISMCASAVQLFFLAVAILIGGGFASVDDNFTLGPKPSVFNVMGAKNAARMQEKGEWWRLFVPLALHAGFLHLVANVFVQLKLGVLLEVLWGPWIWSFIYFGSGIYSILASCIFLPDSLSVGASGGICGLIGADIAFLLLTWRQTLPRDIIERNVQLSSLVVTVLLTMMMGFLPMVDTAAHAGGFLAGLLLGIAIFASRAQDRSLSFIRVFQVLGASLFLALCAGSIAYFYLQVKPHPKLLEMCMPLKC